MFTKTITSNGSRLGRKAPSDPDLVSQWLSVSTLDAKNMDHSHRWGSVLNGRLGANFINTNVLGLLTRCSFLSLSGSNIRRRSSLITPIPQL